MGRKGGGKKAFLKGVVAKPEAEDVPIAATHGQAEAAGVSSESQRDTDQPSTGHKPDSPGLPQLSDVTTSAQDLESESRGQLTQRHKKVVTMPMFVSCQVAQ